MSNLFNKIKLYLKVNQMLKMMINKMSNKKKSDKVLPLTDLIEAKYQLRNQFINQRHKSKTMTLM